MNIETAIEALNRIGYRESHSTDKVLEFRCGDGVLYLNRKSEHLQLFADPKFTNQLRAEFGIRLGDLNDCFNSNLREFPRRQNKGKREERYGTSVKPEDSTALLEFLEWHRGAAGS